LRRAAVALVILAVVALVSGWLVLRASLPQLDGATPAAGLAATVTIERDARGIPSITAGNRADLAYGTGFAHAQDRFFQMDLARRLAAGELSELFGRVAIEQDRHARLFRFRTVARAVVDAGTPEERAILAAYTRGVNAGLAGLRSRPWEYWLLRSAPQAWRDEDTALVALSMWWQLQYADLDRERVRLAVERAIVAQGSADPRAALEFIYPRGTSWDAPAEGRPEDAGQPDDPVVPPPAVLDLRKRALPVAVQLLGRAPQDDLAAMGAPLIGIGSNNWALAGARTRSGAALIANDMHLKLAVPAVWYPARLTVGTGTDATTVAGVTLPGAPMIVAGSNGHIAWGFTNSYGDWLDVTRMNCAADGIVVRPDGVRETLTRVIETIHVRGAGDVSLPIEVAPSGIKLPDGGRDAAARPEHCDLVAWLAAVPAASNFRLLRLERARSVADALSAAPTIGIPHQNLMVGDAAGHIAWTIIGRVPDDSHAPPFLRNTGMLPWRDAATQPRLIDPAAGQIWSANARVADGADEAVIGGDEAAFGAGYDVGARSRQIRDDLRALPGNAAPEDMLAVQLDDRALFLARWQRHLLALLDEPAMRGNFERTEFRRLIAGWDGRAAVDSVSYRLVRTYHAVLRERAWRTILGALDVRDAAGKPFVDVAAPPQFDGALWRLVTERPIHLLPVSSESWRAFELDALDVTLDELATTCRALAKCPYGARRPVAMRHQLSASLPSVVARWLDMPVMPLPGDHDMPRVQDGPFGASERFAVSPGREAEGYLELPGGPSGHPLSPYYRSGFEAWASGRRQPFLPGAAQHRLELRPAADSPAAAPSG
jgi:penicillin amidase